MATYSTEEIGELQKRIDWFDEERRKMGRRLTEMEQRLSQQDKEVANREVRIRDLEEKLARATSQLARLGQLDDNLPALRDELIKMLDQYDQRRIQAQDEQEKLRRIDQELRGREMVDLRKEISPLARLLNDVELRRTEDARLAGLISALQNRVASLENGIENSIQQVEFIAEAVRGSGRSVAELEGRLAEFNKRFESLEVRQEVLSHNGVKAQATMQELSDALAEVRKQYKGLNDQVLAGEYERNQRLELFSREAAERQEQMERYSADWVRYSDQYSTAKNALQAIETFQEQIDKRQRETDELVRVELNRTRAQWESYSLEQVKRWKNFETDQEQRWQANQRSGQQILDQLNALQDALDELNRERDTLWRVQTAQGEALKRLPLIWLEEVEKAIEHDPNTRRQPALVPVRED